MHEGAHTARALPHPAAEDITLDGILHALSDPVRRGILFKVMGCSGLSCSQACTELAPSTISFHYRILREAGLIHSEKKGVEVINAGRKAEIEKRFSGLLHTVSKHHNAGKS